MVNITLFKNNHKEINMKSFLAIVMMVASLNVFAAECIKSEAQMIGTVTDYREIDGFDICMVKVLVTYFNPSVVCPLDAETVVNSWIQVNNCDQSKMDKGVKISGVLVEDRSGLHLEN